MGDVKESLSSTGVDRRSALKKAAAAGLVVWTAPALISSNVSASTVCTPKCAPGEVVSFSGTATKLACSPGAPGQQPVRWNVGVVSTGSATCGCGGSAAVVVSGGGVVTSDPKPGNQSATFPITATVSCTDRQGNVLTRTCTGTGTLAEAGNCNSQPETTTYSGSFNCGGYTCNPA